jgi:SAM-dependent methyltransferase
MTELIKKVLSSCLSFDQMMWCKEKWLPWKSFSYLKYLGNGFYCQICGNNFKRFFPNGKEDPEWENAVGIRYRENAFCPKCKSLDRERLLYHFLENEILPSINKKIRLLHIAPELHIRKILRKRHDIEYLSADIDPKLGQVKMDITAIGYPDNYFDAVICNHVLEHVSDDRKAIREIFRILGLGGWAIMQVPIDLKREDTFEDPNIKTLQDRRQFYGVQTHVRIYGLDYKNRLEECGFNVKQIKYARQLGKDMVDKLSLDPDEDINFCMKR